MKAALTGATGFLGGYLLRRLIDDEEYDEIRVLIRNGNALSELSPKVKDYDVSRVEEFVDGVDVIFHLAAFYTGGDGQDQVGKLVQSNVELTARLAAAAAHTSKKPDFVYATTFSTETGPYGNPANLYSATKKAGEEILKTYRGVYPIFFLRLAETYAPEDSRKKVHNLLRDAILRGDDSFTFMKPRSQLVAMVDAESVGELFANYTWISRPLEIGVNEAKLYSAKSLISLGALADLISAESDIQVSFGEQPVSPLPELGGTFANGWELMEPKFFVKAVKGGSL